MKSQPTLLNTLVAIFLFALQAGAMAQEIESRVRGAWLLTTSADLRTWVLDVRKFKEKNAGKIEYYAYYGANGEQFPKPLDVVFSADASQLTFVALREGTRMEAREESAGVFNGTFTNARGTVMPIRLELVSADDLRRRKFNFPVIAKGARLDFIYLSTDDCVYCRQWESRRKDALLGSAEGKAVTFIAVKGETLRNPIESHHYPEDYKWVFKQIGASRGVPRFLLAIDGQILLNASGTGGYENTFHPALKEVVARRNAAQ